MFEQFPKSKFVVQKRALERRRVFMDHLEKLEDFLEKKQKKMKLLAKKKLKYKGKNEKGSQQISLSSETAAR